MPTQPPADDGAINRNRESNTCTNPKAQPGFKFAEIDFSVDETFLLVQGRVSVALEAEQPE